MRYNIGDKVRVKNDFFYQYDQIPGGRFNCTREIGIIDGRLPIGETWSLYGLDTHQWNRYSLKVGNYSILVREEDLEDISNEEYRCEFDETGTKRVISKSMKLNSMMRRLLNADIKKLIKAGLMNGDLLLTDEGNHALAAILVETYKKELVEIAKEILEEKKEDSNN